MVGIAQSACHPWCYTGQGGQQSQRTPTSSAPTGPWAEPRPAEVTASAAVGPWPPAPPPASWASAEGCRSRTPGPGAAHGACHAAGGTRPALDDCFYERRRQRAFLFSPSSPKVNEFRWFF